MNFTATDFSHHCTLTQKTSDITEASVTSNAGLWMTGTKQVWLKMATQSKSKSQDASWEKPTTSDLTGEPV